jgi:hypothetical protein
MLVKNPTNLNAVRGISINKEIIFRKTIHLRDGYGLLSKIKEVL